MCHLHAWTYHGPSLQAIHFLIWLYSLSQLRQSQWREQKGSGPAFGEEAPVTQGRKEGSQQRHARHQVKCIRGRQNQTSHEESVHSKQKLTVLSTLNHAEKKSEIDSRNCWRPGDINYWLPNSTGKMFSERSVEPAMWSWSAVIKTE